MAEEGLSLLDVITAKAPAEPRSSLDETWSAYALARRSGAAPFVAAVRVAATVDRLGFAFAAGYPAALECLVDGVEFPAALCVTEAQGNTPRATETTLAPHDGAFVLRGTKSFVTFGNLAKTLIVSARVGQRADGRPALAVVKIPAARKGVILERLPEIPFVPEVPHAAVRFDDVKVAPDERLEGDGYLAYVKPFRTIEDIHVVGATLGYLIGLARRSDAEPHLLAELCADLAALDRISNEPPLDPRVHVALQGVYQHLERLLSSQSLAAVLAAASVEERDRWARDQALLRVASKARDARFARALEALA